MTNTSAIAVVIVAVMMATTAGAAVIVASNNDTVKITIYDPEDETNSPILTTSEFGALGEYLADKFNASNLDFTYYKSNYAIVFTLPSNTNCTAFGIAIRDYCSDTLHKQYLYAYSDEYGCWLDIANKSGIGNIPDGMIAYLKYDNL